MATEGVRWTSPQTPSSASRSSPRWSTTGPKTSGPGGCTRPGATARRSLISCAELDGQTITIDAPYVDRMLADIAKSDDLSRYIL